ncbi:energy-coupling factor transporter transmembrane component T [Clostridioides difficile]|uniref:energy-coupling factor transporter transmembrane component T family protein n=1 Tax=Clostridioides difficile TaxID=1496 RepID=UPI001C152DFB|nr:energy-coupling factor transporter transmembrane component T [Clostridioides difficile]MDL0264158.1 energy-coupling factor transporter transmembrane component T [Clostridioides difficile]HBG7896458.1 energy-coupling factor transporter transmembrane protein EcfT [Clostridioides difficile]HCQ6279574.1 energy-coupling factor transporter transmembrane protein EcfT [Clostridioides difficile]
MEQRTRKIDGLGGLACLLLTLISCTVSIFTKDYYMHALFVGWLCIILVYFGFYKQSLFYVVIYTFTTFWLLEMIPKGIVFISPMLLGMVYKFIVPIMAAYLTFKIPSGKLIAVFQKCALPQNIILILLVIIRFIPTISGEFKTIREAMRVRGFTGSVKRILFHPLQTMEYAVVPLIFRSIKVGDELAAASIVRGIENPTKKNSYYETKFTKVDAIILFISICLMLACIFG